MFEKREELLTRIALMIFLAFVPYYIFWIWIWPGWNTLLFFDLFNLVPLAGIFACIRFKKCSWAASLIVFIPLLNVFELDEGFSGPYGFYYNFFPILLANFILFTRKERIFPITGIILSAIVLVCTNVEGWSPRLYSRFPEYAPDAFPLHILNFVISLITTLFGIKFLVQAYQKTETRLKHALMKAEELADLKTQFLSNMSHEIRTPMNAVIGMTNLLMEEHPRKDQQDRLNVLKFSADNLLHIINDILDYSKLEAGKVSFENKPFQLHDTITHVYKGLEPLAIEKGIQLELICDEHLPNLVKGDMNRLVQVINNLAQNAIKFTDQGSVIIRVENHGNHTIGFSIEDTGIGIPDDKLNLIFERFSQVYADSNRKYGGTGLGLAISSKLLELQNSKLKVKSKIGEGSCFSFSIQLQRVIETSETDLLKQKIPSHHPLNCNILLAEDNAINQLVARNFIEKWGANLDIASNGLEAVNMAKENTYDLILMDLQMPEMDGYEATRLIRKLPGDHFSRIPIIALTASSIVEVQEQYILAGMNNYMRKPFVPEELYQMIGHYIWQPRVVSLPVQRA
jgi:signal transduction histidine kinase/CheY-like chemotaxis protein